MTLETSDVSKVANKKTTNEQEIVARKGELDSRDGLVFSLVQKRSNWRFRRRKGCWVWTNQIANDGGVGS